MLKIKTILDRIEGGVGVLSTNAGGQIINIPLNFLPENIKEGDALYLTISLNDEPGETDRQKAKDILNEILTGGAEN
jgi:hypothetical protein